MPPTSQFHQQSGAVLRYYLFQSHCLELAALRISRFAASIVMWIF